MDKSNTDESNDDKRSAKKWTHVFSTLSKLFRSGRGRTSDSGIVDTITIGQVRHNVFRVSDIKLSVAIDIPKPPKDIDTSVRQFEKRLKLRKRAVDNAEKQFPLSDENIEDDVHREALSQKNELFSHTNAFVETSARTLQAELKNRRPPRIE